MHCAGQPSERAARRPAGVRAALPWFARSRYKVPGPLNLVGRGGARQGGERVCFRSAVISGAGFTETFPLPA